MTLELSTLIRRTNPTNTILIFGAGSSIPSGAPSTPVLISSLGEKFKIDNAAKLSLTEISTIIEAKYSRADLIRHLQSMIQGLTPQRGILTISGFDWAGIYTTNYDRLVELAYQRANKDLEVRASNFDFSVGTPGATHLYKLHGTITEDVSLGHQSRMIITEQDYDHTQDYRELLYNKFAEQLFSHDAIVIGQSLADPDLKAVVDKAIKAKKERGAPGKISILSYETDEDRALIYEARGLNVSFGGIDDFFSELTKNSGEVQLLSGFSDNPIDNFVSLLPCTLDVSDACATQTGNLARMFNGSPANYADIMRGWTFNREFSDAIEAQFDGDEQKFISTVIGSAGSGKTTGIRKVLISLSQRKMLCWEHDNEYPLQADKWFELAKELKKRGLIAVLFIDDAHRHLRSLNVLLAKLASDENYSLKIIISTSKPNWNPRFKDPAIYQNGKQYELSELTSRELETLLDMLEEKSELTGLIEKGFLGFNRVQRRKRLSDRCRSDMFVCMRNIFASELFDDIILREFAELRVEYQDAYRRIAGMEAAGVRVHRQLVLRTVKIQPDQVSRTLADLEGLIEERTINSKEGVFSWNVRHGVIAEIISKYKFPEEQEFFDFISGILDSFNPSYDIELKSMDDICSHQGGFGRIYDRNKQNILLRKMISLAPKRRVPRHRLVDNLIRLGNYDLAQTEIRLFTTEMRADGPIERYKIKLLLERSKSRTGLMDEDRAAIAKQAATLSVKAVQRYKDNKRMYEVYFEVGVAYFKYTKDQSIFEDALHCAQRAFDRILDPELERLISKYERVAMNFVKP